MRFYFMTIDQSMLTSSEWKLNERVFNKLALAVKNKYKVLHILHIHGTTLVIFGAMAPRDAGPLASLSFKPEKTLQFS